MRNANNTSYYNPFKAIVFTGLCFLVSVGISAHTAKGGKKISSDLFGLFFEDINYAADGGLYAEMVQNRSFEYSPQDQKGWNPYSFWEYTTAGFSYGRVSVETNNPIHPNNPHYMVVDVEHVGNPSFNGIAGVGFKNPGFDGMVVRAGDKYNFSMLVRQLSKEPISFHVSLQNTNGKVLAESKISTNSGDWKKYSAIFVPSENNDTTSLVILATSTGKFAIDMVSLFPEKTFKNRPNGLRADLAQTLADVKPKFIRFPGGCLVHGDGLGNMYRWKNTIGPLEERKGQRNIWNYHQTGGLGYFEFFQFCEDIGAKPLPVLPAGVSCQNSGGTHVVGGSGQQALPMEEMKEYIQEVLDLIEWANGPVTSTWGAKRAIAGHPAPFNLEYVGIGNEDKMTPEFQDRFKMIFTALKAKYPQITVVGTAGPFHSGEDFDKGWNLAKSENVPVIDEHYYTDPSWFIENQHRYDTYDRKAGEVYLGEYASWGNKLRNAIAEAAYMTGLERNGDVVRMASYAPMLAKKNFTQWTTDLIFFNNVAICPTPNYYVQKMFSTNQGDYYFDKIITKNDKDSTLAASCVQDSKTGDVILKMVNFGNLAKPIKVNLGKFGKIAAEAEQTVLSGNPDAENTFANIQNVIPSSSKIKIAKTYEFSAPAMSLTVVRLKTMK
jgi:alpha-L-arabinofuranosidase